MDQSNQPSSRLVEQLGIPNDVARAIELLKEKLVHAAGSNLAGLILYGGVARGRYRPGKSDVNLVVLLRESSATALGAIAPALQAAWRAVRAEPFILTAHEVRQAADVFPTKLLDIQDHHIVLMGDDPFHDLKVDREHLRLRVEQQLRNLALRLRRRYVAEFPDPVALETTLGRVARSLALELATLLRLAGKEAPADDRTSTIFAGAAAAFGLDHEMLAKVAAVRQGVALGDDAPHVFDRFIAAVAAAAEIADAMGEKP